MQAVLPVIDITVICGHRSPEEQAKAFAEGKSTKEWPDSRHNSMPSEACNIGPWQPRVGIDWNDIERFKLMARIVLLVAEHQGVRLRWGGDWDNDPSTTHELMDYGHFELILDEGTDGETIP